MADAHAHVGKQPDHKVSKAAAGYEHPAKGDEHCGTCTYFERIEKDHCTRVRGTIKSEDWCKLWEQKWAKT